MVGGGSQCMGGRRRRSRKMRGGMYGVDTKAAPIGAGALPYGAAYTGAADPQTGAAVQDPAMPGGGWSGIGGRRRSRKTAKKHRRGHRGTRKMKGGGGQVSAMKAGYGFDGSGAGGLANAVPAPTSGGNAF
jgi:hypothetical protein